LRREITTQEAGTLSGLFRLRVRYSPEKVAFRYFDETESLYISRTWQESDTTVSQWQAALKEENLATGDRVGFMIRTSYERALFELAASRLGLVTVPLPINGFGLPDDMVTILEDTGIRFLLIEGEPQEKILFSLGDIFYDLRVVRLDKISSWLPQKYDTSLGDPTSDPDQLLTIHYTSGTSGKLKGAMLSHRNILSNAEAISNCISIYDNDLLVPFVGGYILPMMMDFETAFPRSIDDLRDICPTHIVSAARLYEYLYDKITVQFMKKPWWLKLLFKQAVETGWDLFEYRQGCGKWHPQFLIWPIFDALIAKTVRKIFGSRLRCAFYSGGILAPEVYKTFIGLGIPLLNCYGQAEAGAISMNIPDDNLPSSVGKPLKGVNVLIENGELIVKSSGVMSGYWNNQTATEEILKQGWLHTGDMVRMDSDGRIFFIGRMSDLIVTQSGNKISPAYIEALITEDPMFDQAMVIGKKRPFLTALLVLNQESLKDFAKSLKLNSGDGELYDPLTVTSESLKSAILLRISEKMGSYTDDGQIRCVTLLKDQWRVQDGLVTISSKLKRASLAARYGKEIEKMYAEMEQ